MSLRRPAWLEARKGLLLVLIFVLSALALFAFYQQHPVLYDADAYYHLAIGRAFAEEGWIEQLPWLRASILEDGFGDKELLFHALLAPFASADDPVAGGRLALALFNAALITVLAALGSRALGIWGLALPFWLIFASTEMSWRLVRLRPELLSLLLLLLALAAAGGRRYRWLGLITLLYTLSYTAFHVLPGLCLMLFLLYGWVRKEWQLGLVLYPTLGSGLGILLHPHFPKSLEVWLVQNVAFFLDKGQLDVGTEIRPNFTDVALMVNLGWLLGLLILWRAARSRPGIAAPGPGPQARQQATDHRLALAFGLAAVVFGGLYLLMSRFSLYAVPFVTLALVFSLRAQGRPPGAWVRLPGRGRVPLALAALLCVLISLPEAQRQLQRFASRTDPGPQQVRFQERKAFAAVLPPGAKVVAPWTQTAIYMLYAPQGRYLNVLEPNFMASRDRRAYDVQRAIFEGHEPDVPLAAAQVLDSQFLAYSLVGASRELTERLQDDPRVRTRHRMSNVLFELLPGNNRGFVLDWTVLGGGDEKAVEEIEPAPDLVGLPIYPRPPLPKVRAFEGYVDALRVDPSGQCLRFAREEVVQQARRQRYEFAPYGPATLMLNGQTLLDIGGEPLAILGRAAEVEVELAPGTHRFEVRTCPPRGRSDRNGFYLLQRSATAPPMG